MKTVEKIGKIVFPLPKCITDGTHSRTDLPIIPRYEGWLKTKPTSYSMSNRIPSLMRFLFNHSKKNIITIIDHPKDLTPNTLTTIQLLMPYAKSITYWDILKDKKDE